MVVFDVKDWKEPEERKVKIMNKGGKLRKGGNLMKGVKKGLGKPKKDRKVNKMSLNDNPEI